MLVGFSSGYWHASPPTAYFKQQPGAARRVEEARHADGHRRPPRRPRGDHPLDRRRQDLVAAQGADRHPVGRPGPEFLQLKDGTILCSLFTYPGPTATDLARDPARTTLTGIIRSFDNGRTWEQEPKRLPVPFTCDATDGPIIELKDGSALICVYGKTVGARHEMVAFCRSTDRGTTWELLSTLATDHEMSETAVAQLPDGRLVIVARPEGDVAWSSDGRPHLDEARPAGRPPLRAAARLPARRHAALPARLVRRGRSAGDAQHGRRPDVALSESEVGLPGRPVGLWLLPGRRTGRRHRVGRLHPHGRPFDEGRAGPKPSGPSACGCARPRRHRPAAGTGEVDPEHPFGRVCPARAGRKTCGSL